MLSKLIESKIMEILRKVRDPELNGNVVELGLIRRIDVYSEKKIIEVRWIPTAPMCPLVAVISAAMRYAIMNSLEVGGWEIRVLVDESVPTASYWNSQLSNTSYLDKIIAKLQETGQMKFFISK